MIYTFVGGPKDGETIELDPPEDALSIRCTIFDGRGGTEVDYTIDSNRMELLYVD